MEAKQVDIAPVPIADLRGVDIFAGLSDENLGLIVKSSVIRGYRAGEYCAVQGKTTDQLLIVNSGKVAVEVWVDVPRHSHTVTIATLTKGRVCAWSALVPPYVLTGSVRCMEPVQMIAINDSDLRRLLANQPQVEAVVMRNLAGVISSRLRDSQTQLTRLCAEILKEGIKYKGEGKSATYISGV